MSEVPSDVPSEIPSDADPPTSVNCSRCNSPVLVTDDLARAFSRIPDRATVRLLCPACSQTDDAPPTQTRAERVFRVSLLIQELAEEKEVVGGPEDGKVEEVWADLGGFQLRGSGDSVKGFVDAQAGEFGRRMEMILNMADMPEEQPESVEE